MTAVQRTVDDAFDEVITENMCAAHNEKMWSWLALDSSTIQESDLVYHCVSHSVDRFERSVLSAISEAFCFQGDREHSSTSIT